jgi:hypothetical protein
MPAYGHAPERVMARSGLTTYVRHMTHNETLVTWVRDQLATAYRPMTAAELAAHSPDWTAQRIRHGLRELQRRDLAEPVPRRGARGVAWQLMSAGPDELPA